MKMAGEQVKNEMKEMNAERKEKRKREMRNFTKDLEQIH